MPAATFLPRMRQAVEHIKTARDLMSNGPLDYYLMKLCEHSEALLTQFSPIKAGGRAVIIREIECKNGWAGAERTLAVGAVGVVDAVDYVDGRFVFDFIPDRQWWKDDKGEWHEKDRKHSYCLSDRVLRPVEA